MPLIHKKTPAAFKKNIEIEMRAGKPQKQAVAIAYNEKREAEHKHADGGCIGPECMGCSSPNCYAEGGSVNSWTKREDNEMGINKAPHLEKMSSAGVHVRAGNAVGGEDKADSYGAAKLAHMKTLKEMKGMPKPNLMAEGGECIGPECTGCESGNCYAGGGDVAVRGVHKELINPSDREQGISAVGKSIREGDKFLVKGAHKQVLDEARRMKKSNLMAEGGEIEDHEEPDGDEFMDDEMKNVVGDEFINAFERKDKKSILDTLTAFVLSLKDDE